MTVLSRMGVRRYSGVEFLIVLVVWLAFTRIVMQFRHGDLIEAVLATIVMLSAVVAVGGRRRTLIAAALLVAPACVCKWINHVRPDLLAPEFHAMAAMIFLAFIVVQFLRFILLAPRVTVEVLCAAASGYLLIGILWALAYTLVAQVVPASFTFGGGPGRAMIGMDALYSSFVRLCTVGYGDIVPASHASRMLAVFEAAAGTIYVTVLIARPVSLYSAERRAHDRRDGIPS